MSNKALIMKNINFIAKAGKRFDAFVQTTALLIAQRIEDHGDITLAERLFEAMPRGSRLNALKDWFHSFTKLRFDDKGVGAFDGTATTNIQGAIAKPWYDCKVEPPYKPLDLVARITVLLNEATKRDALDEDLGDKIDPNLLVALKAAAGQHQVVLN